MLTPSQLSSALEASFNEIPGATNPENLYGYIRRSKPAPATLPGSIICLMAHQLFNYPDANAFAVAKAVFCIMHAGSIHDDVIASGQLQVEAMNYQASTAVLAADVLWIKIFEYLNEVDESLKSELFTILSQLAKGYCEARQLQLQLRTGFAYGDIINFYKESRKITFAFPGKCMQAGAITSGTSVAQGIKLLELGTALGAAIYYKELSGATVDDAIPGNQFSAKEMELLMISPGIYQELCGLKAGSFKHGKSGIEHLYRNHSLDDYLMNQAKQAFTNAFNILENVATTTQRKIPLEMLLRSITG